jgi:dynein heavy chain 2, cytosolic
VSRPVSPHPSPCAQERRTFIPQGWSQFYEFSDADFAAGSAIVARASAGPSPRWPFILGLLESAVYGGRINNAADARTLRAYLEIFFHRKLLEGSVPVPGTTMPLPSLAGAAALGELRHTIESLPEPDTPAVFGLAANVDRAAQETSSMFVIEGLQLLNLRALGIACFDREEWRQRLQPVILIWEGHVRESAALRGARSLARVDSHGGKVCFSLVQGSHLRYYVPQLRLLRIPCRRHVCCSFARQVTGAMQGTAAHDPVAAFLAQEQCAGSALVAIMDASLRDLAVVLSGATPLHPAASATGTALLRGATPDTWLQVWGGPETPVDFMHGVATRVTGGAALSARHAVGGVIGRGEPVPLNHLFQPMALVSTLRQVCANRARISIDALTLTNAWDVADVTPQCTAPLLVTGLMLEGAVCEGRDLRHVTRDSPAVTPLKPLVLAWTPRGEGGGVTEAARVKVAVYSRRDRQVALLELDLAVRSLPLATELVLAGVAAFVDG